MTTSGAEVRKKILEQVEGCVCRDRNNSYGDAIDNFRNIADLWEVYLRPKLAPGACVTPCDVAMMSGLIKVARAIHSPDYLDSWVDLAGYAVCGAGIVTQEKERKEALGPRWVAHVEKEAPEKEADVKAASAVISPDAPPASLSGYRRYQRKGRPLPVLPEGYRFLTVGETLIPGDELHYEHCSPGDSAEWVATTCEGCEAGSGVTDCVYRRKVTK